MKRSPLQNWKNWFIWIESLKSFTGRLPEIFPIYLEKYVPQFGYKKEEDFLEDSVASKTNKSLSFIDP
jgi:hypothetical protein